MADFEVKLPRMGESVAEATVTNWCKKVGDSISLDEPIVEIATDKVDSEIPSEVEGTLKAILFEEDAVVKVGETIAIIEVEGDVTNVTESSIQEEVPPQILTEEQIETSTEEESAPTETFITSETFSNSSDKFYSPLVKNIAKKENIGINELESIPGTGKEGRVTKFDILAYLKKRSSSKPTHLENKSSIKEESIEVSSTAAPKLNGEGEIIEMSRIGKLIAKHMQDSIQTSVHVQSFIEVDVTAIVNWRNQVKEDFNQRIGEKITFTPIFMLAIAKAIRMFPMVNIKVLDSTKIIKLNAINLGMAVALDDGNLIVPVIKNADLLNLTGMTRSVNDLALRARKGQLQPNDIKDATFTVTNVGSFGSLFGTPIINQPQVAILALGAIRKTPSVIETPDGDTIGIRHKMFLSMSYDHRVVNGALGGMFIKKVKELLENWDRSQDY